MTYIKKFITKINFFISRFFKTIKENKFKLSDNWPIYIAFFIVSLSVLAFEVVINRMFAFMFWYHFAFIIISIALFGIGVGGMLVFFVNKFLKKWISPVLATLTFFLAVSIPLSLLKINMIHLRMELVGKNPAHDIAFIKVFLILSIPFIISGFIFSFVFTNYREKINKMYFFDLAGGGIGCLLVLFLFPGRGPILTSFLISIAVLYAAVLFLFNKSKTMAIISAPIIIYFALSFIYPKVQNIELRIAKGNREAIINEKGEYISNLEKLNGKRVFARWDNFGFVAVHKRSENNLKITADYSCSTPLLKIPFMKNHKGLNFGFMYDHKYPYIINKKPRNVGIIGVGGGKDVMQALAMGAENIYGAEFNQTIFDLYDNIYADFIGKISKRANVQIINDEGRFFIRSSERKYDILVFDNTVAQTAISSGAFTVAESYVYTVEAIIDYIEHLEPNGIMYFSNPYTDAERFAPLIRAAFKEMGRSSEELQKSVFITDNQGKGYRKCKVLVRNGIFSEKEARKLKIFANSLGHKILFSSYHKTNSTVYEAMTTTDLKTFYEKSPTEVRPPTDNWPFFTQRVKPEMTARNKQIQKTVEFYPEPFLWLKRTTGYVGLAAIAFLILPLLFFNLHGFAKLKNKIGSIIYFICLGLGFMFLEIVLMQKYMLVLGHPIYSFAIVLSGLLISSGVGSLFSKKIKDPYKAVITGIIGIIAATIIFLLFSTFLSKIIVGFPFKIRAIITILLVSLNGFFMGYLMPSGIRIIGQYENAIPWMWAINSVFSVLASFLAFYLSILYGYYLVLFLAIAIYTFGGLCLIIKRNKLA